MSNTSHQPNLRPARRPWPIAIAGLGAAALLAACGSGVTGTTAGSTTGPSQVPSATPTATASISCAQVTALRAALTNLDSISLNANTGSQISADLTEVETALTAMKGEISSTFAAEARQISADLTTVGKHAQALAVHPSRANLEATTTGVRRVKTAVGPAIAAMRTACTSS
jgi:hypothetical protein